MTMNPRLILGGLKSFLPFPTGGYKGTGGTVTGRYCYSVWLRHLTLISKHVREFRPRSMVELGPGDSIGVGLAALLTGMGSYIGLDALDHTTIETNLRVLEELVDLVRQHAPIPDETDFPRLHPRLPSYEYPSSLIDESKVVERLSQGYVARLRAALQARSNAPTDPVRYYAPWTASMIPPASVDLIVSQGALQDMDHLPADDVLGDNVAAMTGWLKPGGVMSHQVELACPGGAEWNHHWAYGDFAWRIVRGHRPYYKNRVPLSEYLSLMKAVKCEVMDVLPFKRDGLTRERVAPRFRGLPDEDFRTAAALIVAVKR